MVSAHINFNYYFSLLWFIQSYLIISFLFLNYNYHIKEGRGNGTKFIGLSSKMKTNSNADFRNLDGRLIHKVASIHVDYTLCKTVPDKRTEWIESRYRHCNHKSKGCKDESSSESKNCW